tara:strand:+ start:512 stop:721 length:210 start_codon:yes stop_codon:yes gene_type:complete
MTKNISPWLPGDTDNERFINLLKAIDEFHCPQAVKQRALDAFGITQKVVYEHPLQQQLDSINRIFDNDD